jgi:hypothetical protein
LVLTSKCAWSRRLRPQADLQTAARCKLALGFEEEVVRITVHVCAELPPPVVIRPRGKQPPKTLPQTDVEVGKTGAAATSAGAAIDPNRGWIYIGGCCIFFLRYVVATFLSPFFADICQEDKLDISILMQGLIFSCFPVGIAVTSLVGPPIIMRFGTRTSVAVGILGTAVFTVMFGLVPDMVRLEPTPRWFGWYSEAQGNGTVGLVNPLYANLVLRNIGDRAHPSMGEEVAVLWALPHPRSAPATHNGDDTSYDFGVDGDNFSFGDGGDGGDDVGAGNQYNLYVQVLSIAEALVN